MLDTYKNSRGIFRFVVLIPHRDFQKPLAACREKLFAAGFPGAYSFPLAAPLAALSRPLRHEELGALARNIRELTNARDGKITCGTGASGGELSFTAGSAVPAGEKAAFAAGNAVSSPAAIFWEAFTFFGPRLNIALAKAMFPASAHAKILHVFSPPVICTAIRDANRTANRAALAEPETDPVLSDFFDGPAGTPNHRTNLSFRAAAIANLAIRPLAVSCGAVFHGGGDIAAGSGDTAAHDSVIGAGTDGRGPFHTGEGNAAPPFSFEWKRGPLVWLPAYKKERGAESTTPP